MNQHYPHDPNQPFAPQQPFPAQHQAPKKNHRARNVIGGVAAGIVTLIFIIGFFADDPSSSEASNTPLPNVVTTTDEPAVVKSTEPAAPKPTKPAAPKTNAPKPVVTPKPAPTVTQPSLTKSQEQAIGSAESYLGFTAFSRKGLIHQLSSAAGEGFSVADATYAVNHIKVDWNEQAAKSAKSYLEMTHFSRQGLIHQLESSAGDGFTHRQAVYGVTKAGL